MTLVSPEDRERIASIAGKDTPPRGKEIALPEAVKFMATLGATEGFQDFFQKNPIYGNEGRRFWYGKRTHAGAIDFQVRAIEGLSSNLPTPDGSVAVVTSWRLTADARSRRESLQVGWFDEQTWSDALKHAEALAQAWEPNSFEKSLRVLGWMLKHPRSFVSDWYAIQIPVNRIGDVLPALTIAPRRGIASLSARQYLGSEIQVITENNSALGYLLEPQIQAHKQALEQSLKH